MGPARALPAKPIEKTIKTDFIYKNRFYNKINYSYTVDNAKLTVDNAELLLRQISFINDGSIVVKNKGKLVIRSCR